MSPDEVLRKGSGTLCESLLMVEALPWEHRVPEQAGRRRREARRAPAGESRRTSAGTSSASQTGVFRADIPTKFRLNPKGYQKLLDSLDDDLEYALEDGGRRHDPGGLRQLRRGARRSRRSSRRCATTNQSANPLIYHLDVGAMYPNIILTNRLQPPADGHRGHLRGVRFQQPGEDCKREMEWLWRGESSLRR